MEDSGLEFSMANDSKNIYVHIAPNNDTAKKLLARAYAQNFTIWLDAARENGIKLVQPKPAAPEQPADLQNAATAQAQQPAPGNQSAGNPPAGAPPAGNPPSGNPPSGMPQSGQVAASTQPVSGQTVAISTEIIKMVGYSRELNSEMPPEKQVEIKIGDVYHDGSFELRIPLALFGQKIPEQFEMGFEADALPSSASQPATKVIYNPYGGGSRTVIQDAGTTQETSPLSVWLNVTLAEKPQQ